MASRRDSVRGRVVLRWEDSADREWGVRRRVGACIEADGELEREGLKPALEFRRVVKLNNQTYLIQWTWGCHFDWLNPR